MSLSLREAKASSLGMQGDPGGFTATVGGFLRKVAKSAFNATPVGKAVSVIRTIGGMQQPMKLPLLPGGGAGFFAPRPGVLPMHPMGINRVGGSRAGLKKDGTPRRVKRNGEFYKRPSMNFGNGRAIRRAARRLEGAEKLFRRIFVIRHAKHPAGVHPKALKH